MAQEQKEQKKQHPMDLPVELRIGQPRVTMVGNEIMFVENHSGLLEYSPVQIRFRAGQGIILVAGQRLMLERMGGGIVRITGQIVNIALQGGLEGVL